MQRMMVTVTVTEMRVWFRSARTLLHSWVRVRVSEWV